MFLAKSILSSILGVLKLFKKTNPDDSVLSEKIRIEGGFNTSVFRKQQNYFLREAKKSFSDIQTVLNVGALPDDNDKEGSKYKEYFKEAEFYTLDKNRNIPDPRHFNMDLHNLSTLDKKFDLILLMSTLEHVKNPFIVADEIQGSMKKDSYLFVSVPFLYPMHKDEDGRYSDYWRFTDDSLRILFNNLQEMWIKPMHSSIESVRDRGLYWEKSKTPSGYCALFKKS
jgi:hypothetical protein